jgi:hypothetical protein
MRETYKIYKKGLKSRSVTASLLIQSCWLQGVLSEKLAFEFPSSSHSPFYNGFKNIHSFLATAALPHSSKPFGLHCLFLPFCPLSFLAIQAASHEFLAKMPER